MVAWKKKRGARDLGTRTPRDLPVMSNPVVCEGQTVCWASL